MVITHKERYTKEFLSKYFHLPITEVSKSLGICTTMLKKICRKNGISRWPYRKIRSIDKILDGLEILLRTNPPDADELRREIAFYKFKRQNIINHPETLTSKKKGSKDLSDSSDEADFPDVIQSMNSSTTSEKGSPRSSISTLSSIQSMTSPAATTLTSSLLSPAAPAPALPFPQFSQSRKEPVIPQDTSSLTVSLVSFNPLLPGQVEVSPTSLMLPAKSQNYRPLNSSPAAAANPLSCSIMTSPATSSTSSFSAAVANAMRGCGEMGIGSFRSEMVNELSKKGSDLLLPPLNEIATLPVLETPPATSSTSSPQTSVVTPSACTEVVASKLNASCMTIESLLNPID